MVARKTVAEYFEILRDTLIGQELPAWTKSKKRKAICTSKFYFFDLGVGCSICDLPPVKEKSADFGEAFEHYIFHELRTYIDCEETGLPLSYTCLHPDPANGNQQIAVARESIILVNFDLFSVVRKLLSIQTCMFCLNLH